MNSEPNLKTLGRRLAAICGLLVAGIAFLVLGSWVAGRWQMGTLGSDFIPMAPSTALPTAIAFMLLGAALLALSAREPSPELQSPPRRMGWWAATAFTVLAVGVALAGWFQLRTDLGTARLRVEAELNAIADLKVQQIAEWRRERLADAALIGQAAFVARDVQAFFNDPSPAAKAELIHWLTLFVNNYGYSRVSLFDARGELRLMLPDDGVRPGPVMRSHISDVLRDPRVQMTDLHRDDSGDLRINLAIPVFAPAPSTVNAQPSAPLAVLLLELDPNRFLYPLIQTWPTPSRTAETLLGRRDGDDALYLNEVRHRTNTALSLRVPLTRTELPAVRGALGQVGTFETVDYRGVPVHGRRRTADLRHGRQPRGVTQIQSVVLHGVRREN